MPVYLPAPGSREPWQASSGAAGGPTRDGWGDRGALAAEVCGGGTGLSEATKSPARMTAQLLRSPALPNANAKFPKTRLEVGLGPPAPCRVPGKHPADWAQVRPGASASPAEPAWSPGQG